MPTILDATPTLPSTDLDRTRDFYEQKLGFQTTSRYPDYLIIARDGVYLHFWKCDDRQIPQSAGCYLYVDNAEALFAEYQAQGVIHPNGAIRDTDYGVREFAVLDDSGCLLRIGQRLKVSA
jgi:catechol 2,3-dioxygenase-like lactoylglutathione lyase family enzyme